MAGGTNVVEILVRASDSTAEGFGKAKASASASADDIAAAEDRVTAAEDKLRQAQISQADAQLKLEELQQSGSASADELAAAQDKVTMATIRAADAQIRLGDADARLAVAERGAGDAAEVQAAKTAETGKSGLLAGAGLKNFGMIGGVALAGVGYEAIKMGMSFQSAMERLVTQAGVAPKMLAPLKAGILSLAGSVGFSPDSLSESLYHVASNMASLGATAPKMLSMVKTAAEGAAVGGANLEDVTNALTAAVASGIPGVQNFSQAMGALNAIVGAGDMKMQDLADAMGTGVLATVKGYGLSLKDVGAALAVFGDNNIRGSLAANELRMAVQALGQPAAAGKAALASMGLSMTALGKDMQSGGLLKALEDLQAHFKRAGITAKEQGAEITDIFGKKAGTGLNVLMDQMDRLKSKYPDITKGAASFGSAWDKTQQTAAQQFKELRATVDALMTSIGERLLPVIQAMAGFLLRNKGVIEALAPAVLAVVAAFTLLEGVTKAWELLSKLDPWTIAITAVIVATVLLVEHWKQVKAVAETVFRDVTHAIETAFDWVKAHWPLLLSILTGPIGAAVIWIVEHWKQVTDGAKRMGDDVIAFFRALPGRILSALAALPGMLFSAGVNAIKGLIHGFESMMGSVGSTIGNIASKVAGFFGLSPAVEGPLSGGGAPEIRGQHFAADIARGMLSGRGAVVAAANQLAGAAGASGSSRADGYGSSSAPVPVVVQFEMRGGSGLDHLFWQWFQAGVRAKGGDPRIVTTKVRFLGG